ncbi:diphthine synthase [Candidatus Woesearchaeota archaeon]|nr:diphthine synthase [Candidatus Woesearchaeota archaeon]
MVLYFIGLGLAGPKDVTVQGLETIRKCKKVYLESYTSLLQCSREALEQEYGKEVIAAGRDLVETRAEETILKDAAQHDVAFLVVGDPFGATTHIDLFLRAQGKGIATKIIHNASIMNAIACTGLELYKFGRTVSIVFPEKNWVPETPYSHIRDNKNRGLHTLCLLDIQRDRSKVMTIQEGLNLLLEMEQKKKEKVISGDTSVVACARIGAEDQKIAYGAIKDILQISFGSQPHCFIIPGKLHFKEEEMLELWGIEHIERTR